MSKGTLSSETSLFSVQRASWQWQAMSAIDDVKGSSGAIHCWDANCLGSIAWEKGPARHLAAVTAFEARKEYWGRIGSDG